MQRAGGTQVEVQELPDLAQALFKLLTRETEDSKVVSPYRVSAIL